ncbi:hypothetical protein [Actinacidiphila acidipaludis]|uniref:Uncharacterized protein n=1 Tax=Actinacidiphila acidipaludis TaxID=2873382 RepID=A0ABS7QAJ8_9ACTN|nr:hypothetical protein [Streptomyces acidipaludis]MBY8879754.1 hypothetical protein [Streptomyces acidipaludis]
MGRDYRFNTIDFRPAAPGWRYVVLAEDGTMQVLPLPGWLIQEEIEYPSAGSDDGTPTGSRRVVAARMEDDYVEAFSSMPSFWCVIGPGEDEPSQQEVAEEQGRREAFRNRQQARKDNPTA